jgi:DNA repair exonuclease SbcCD ATPase subunit
MPTEKKPPVKRPPSKTSVKKEMLEAYSELLPQMEEAATELKPEKKAEAKAAARAVAVADGISADGVLSQISALRSELGKLLVQLSEKLEQEVGRYQAVKRAIEEKEADLKDLYEIEKSAGSLAALIEAQNLKKQEFEATLDSRKEQAVAEVQSAREQWEKDKAEWDAQLKERQEAENRKRDRDKEEYEYRFKREKQQMQDQLADERAKMGRELAVKRIELEQDLADREKAVAERERQIDELRGKVEAFPAELKRAVDLAVADTTARLEADAKNREEILKSEFEGERKVLTTRIQSLEKAVKEQSDQISRLVQQLDKAYQQVQEIAVRAIEGSSNSKSLAGLQQLLSESARRSTP